MTRISSKMTFYYKRVLPIVFFGFLLFFMLTPVLAGRAEPPPLFFFVVPILFAVFFYVLMRKLIFALVDEVCDDGDALIVRNGTTQDRIPLTNIKNVSYSHLINPPRATLALRQPGKFGSEVSFCPPMQLNPFARSPIMEALIDRIDEARGRGR